MCNFATYYYDTLKLNDANIYEMKKFRLDFKRLFFYAVMLIGGSEASASPDPNFCVSDYFMLSGAEGNAWIETQELVGVGSRVKMAAIDSQQRGNLTQDILTKTPQWNKCGKGIHNSMKLFR